MNGTFERFVRMLGRTVMVVGVIASVFTLAAAWRLDVPVLLVFAAFAGISAWYGHRVAGRPATTQIRTEGELAVDLAA